MSGIYPNQSIKIIDAIRMRYSTTVDGKNYYIDQPDGDLLMLDQMVRDLATLVAQKIYGKLDIHPIATLSRRKWLNSLS